MRNSADDGGRCNFSSPVFWALKPDTFESLALTKSSGNRDPLSDSVINIAKAGIRVMAGYHRF
jgi:hypothetical protein